MIARIGAEAVVLDSATGDRDDSDREALGVCVITDELADEVSPVDTSELPDLTGDDLALIQFTTGATGRAKGAALTHRAVCNQVRHYAQAMATDDADVIVLPLRLHDNAALMAGLLQAIMTGAELVLVSPHAWVNRPVALLEAITQRRGTLCWMPNYAVALLADRVPAAHRVGCDLSSLRSLINCTDLCRADTMWSFAARYQPCGLDPAALGIAYTMAENGFAVAQTSLKCPPRVHRVAYRDLIDHHRIVDATGEAVAIDVLACGRAIDGTSIRIVDEAGRPAQDRQVGEIAVRGDAMFAGYARTETAVEHDHDGWQYTGDLGYLRDGDLYVLGRKSDGIVVGERTVYPQPIEAVASSVEGVHEGRVVALGLPDHQGGTDRLVILFEPEDENQADITLAEIERRATQADCPVDAVVPVPRKWLMKTVAGRMARGTNRNRYLAMLDDETADRPKIKHPQRLRIMSSTTTHA
jgi:acyl-CoA synthetase (AMP-forming)/AMP-acid ligase II